MKRKEPLKTTGRGYEYCGRQPKPDSIAQLMRDIAAGYKASCENHKTKPAGRRKTKRI